MLKARRLLAGGMLLLLSAASPAFAHLGGCAKPGCRRVQPLLLLHTKRTV